VPVNRVRLVAACLALLLLAGSTVACASVEAPVCTVNAPPSGTPSTFDLTPEQASNAATITAVGTTMGLPAHAATIALATAMQESKLVNLPGGDRDSIGLFQQRPSQGWGTPAQVSDPIYAATAFYKRLAALPNWENLPVTDAAQQVQRSGAPEAYAQWEPLARAAASALTGQYPAGLTCSHLAVGPATADLVTTATAELGTAALSGPHPVDRGWAICGWLVAHASSVGVDQVSFAGRTWTAAAGAWAQSTSPADVLSLHVVSRPPATS
jgi:hypothetical protein